MTKIAINGFGRIGRAVCRILQQRNTDIELVAINDLADNHTMAHLLKYDSVHGIANSTIDYDEDSIIINGKRVTITHNPNPAELPWKELDVDIVIESTGRYLTKELASLHLQAGAKKVVLSAPAKSEGIKTVVMGINDHILDGNEDIVSNASCTTNSAAPLIKILDELCGISNAYITTVHSYTMDQRIHDSAHKDLRRARAAAENIIPTTTGAAKAITKIFPHLEGHIGGCGIRVPVPDGSLTDISAVVKNLVSEDEINEAFKNAANNELKGYMQYTNEPIVSRDIIGNSHSSIFDAGLTSVVGNMVKIVGWYDNEYGYSNRIIDLLEKISQ
ncbi:MAG TPA: type I glyceraldehyde-3-phosphate dehydrogenase [Flavobacteriales bacterium]|nr:type I glyceraldehyde-3-phosphate dehydrogenase [Flavobacteriales bacterium]|tara:strand:- start:22599 stop:23594 length:996 start_codon:yes stop_codon:yes gene_type:complete